MSACATQVFANVTPERWTALLARAKAQGIDITGDSGTFSRDGFTGAWNYDPASLELSIQCTAKPFFVSCGLVNAKEHEFFDPLLI